MRALSRKSRDASIREKGSFGRQPFCATAPHGDTMRQRHHPSGVFEFPMPRAPRAQTDRIDLRAAFAPRIAATARAGLALKGQSAMAHASHVVSARAMAHGTQPLA